MQEALEKFKKRFEGIDNLYSSIVKGSKLETGSLFTSDGEFNYEIASLKQEDLDSLRKELMSLQGRAVNLELDMESFRKKRSEGERELIPDVYSQYSDLVKNVRSELDSIKSVFTNVDTIYFMRRNNINILGDNIREHEKTLQSIDAQIRTTIINIKRAMFLRQGPNDVFLASNTDILEPDHLKITLNTNDRRNSGGVDIFSGLDAKRLSISESDRENQNVIINNELAALRSLLFRKQSINKELESLKEESDKLRDGVFDNALNAAARFAISQNTFNKSSNKFTPQKADLYKELKNNIFNLKERYFAEVLDLNNYSGLIKKSLKDLKSSHVEIREILKESYDLLKNNLGPDNDDKKKELVNELGELIDNIEKDSKVIGEVVHERESQAVYFDGLIQDVQREINKEEEILMALETESVSYKYILGYAGYNDLYIQKYNKVHTPKVDLDYVKSNKDMVEKGILDSNYFEIKLYNTIDNAQVHGNIKAKYIEDLKEYQSRKHALENGKLDTKYWNEKLIANSDVVLGRNHYNEEEKVTAVNNNKENIKNEPEKTTPVPEKTIPFSEPIKASEATKAPETTKAPEATKAPEVPATLPETNIDDKEKAKQEEKSSSATKEDEPIPKDTWVTKLKKKFSIVGDYVKNHPVKTGLMAAAGVGAGVVVVNLVPLLPTVGMVAAGYFIYKELDKAGVLGK